MSIQTNQGTEGQPLARASGFSTFNAVALVVLGIMSVINIALALSMGYRNVVLHLTLGFTLRFSQSFPVVV